jgi:hypothetical protein
LSHKTREDNKDKFRYKFSLLTFYEDGELRRELVESVFSSIEKSLEVFDEIFAKLETATATSRTAHQKNDNN